MKIFFLTAGRGRRLNYFSKKKHKSLLQLNKQDTILGKLVEQFQSFGCKKKNIYFITGYKTKQIRTYFGRKYNYFFYKNFIKTNNLHTLIDASKLISSNNTIISFSDIVIETKAIKKFYKKKSKNISILVDNSSVRNGTMKVQIDQKNKLKKIGKIKKKISHGNYIGIIKIPKEKIKLFKAFLCNSQNKNRNSYFTEVLNDMIKKNNEKIDIVRVGNSKWVEIDNVCDYKKALNNVSSFY